jgi:predicted alpha/beta hydrolase family esterase
MLDMFDDFDVLVLPGWHGSGPDSWQTHWQHAFPAMQRVMQDDWDTPRYDEWAKRLSDYIDRCSKPVILIAHSLGTSLTTRWSQEFDTSKVAGAFLVAPSDRESAKALANDAIKGFAPMMLAKLPFPTMLISSADDPHVSPERARHFADAWGSTFIDVGALGHIGAGEKLGLWPEGLILFGRFVQCLKAL